MLEIGFLFKVEEGPLTAKYVANVMIAKMKATYAYGIIVRRGNSTSTPKSEAIRKTVKRPTAIPLKNEDATMQKAS